MKLANGLSLYSVAICVVVFAGIVAVIERGVNKREARQVQRVEKLLKDHLDKDLSEDLKRVAVNVRHTAIEIDDVGPSISDERAGRILSRLLESDTLVMGAAYAEVPEYSIPAKENMVYITRNDSSVKIEQLGGTTYDYTHQAWYTQPVEEDKGVWSKPYVEHEADDARIVTFSLPVKDKDGRIYAVVTADLTTKSIADEIESLRPKHDADSLVELRNVQLPLLFVITGGLILLIVVIHLTVKRQTRPLVRLAEAAASIGGGDFHTPLPTERSYTEINRLRDAMAHMQESIQKYVGEIADKSASMARMRNEIEIARKIQMSMLPLPWPESGKPVGDSRIQIAALLEPARTVSGDLYAYQAEGRYLYFIIADVSDKGVPASLVMASTRSMFSYAVNKCLTPSDMATSINRVLCANNEENMFVTAIIGRIDTATSMMLLANAGHDLPYIVSPERKDFLPLPPGLPLGIMDDFTYGETEIQFGSGDTLFLYTDGLTEAENAHGEQFGEKRIAGFIGDGSRFNSPLRLVEGIRREVGEFAREPLGDDITLMAIRCDRLHDTEKKETAADSIPLCCESIRIDYLVPEIDRMHSLIDSVSQRLAWPDDFTQRLRLMAEEAVTNVIMHSEPDKPGEKITVELCAYRRGADLTIRDRGRKFNPINDADDPDISADLGERVPGGLGIFLIKQMATSLVYNYTENQNNFIIRLDL